MSKLREKVEAKIKAVMYVLIAETHEQDEAGLKRTEQDMKNMMEMQKDEA